VLSPDNGDTLTATIAVIGDRASRYAPDEPYLRLDDARDLDKVDQLPVVVLIAESSPVQRRATLAALREHMRTSLLPMYVLGPATDADPLADGNVTAAQAALDNALEIHAAAAALPAGEPADVDARLLRFLYMRAGIIIAPERIWDAPLGYTYPLLDAFAGDLDVVSWLRMLERRKLIDRAELIDRLRHCPQCDYVHLNYVDICPNSKSIDIVKMPFLHCFICGNVAPEERFLDGGRLTCPKCTTHLRAVGVDYDRALESFHCNDCGFDFSEPDVTALCLHCGRRTPPEDLIARDVHVLALSEGGRLAARASGQGDVFAPLDQLDFATPAFFFATFDLLHRIEARYKQSPFTLVGVRLANVDEVLAANGSAKTLLIMDEIARRLRELLRTTDVTTRTAETDVWMLLSQTTGEQATKVIERIAELERSETVEPPLHLATVMVTSADLAEGESAQLVLGRAANAFS
jgi:GGDEF domain-containing protein